MASEKEKQARSEHAHAEHHEKSEHKDKEKSHEKSHTSRSEKDSGSMKETHNQGKNNRDSKSSAKENRLPAGKSARTTDHEVIRRWIEERGGSPATVKATESGSDPGLLRINFPGYSGANRLEDIPWEDFFKKFDEKHLEFLYQDETRDGETSRFWKFVAPTGESGNKGGSKKGDKK